jgi:hypothetical protein
MSILIKQLEQIATKLEKLAEVNPDHATKLYQLMDAIDNVTVDMLESIDNENK